MPVFGRSVQRPGGMLSKISISSSVHLHGEVNVLAVESQIISESKSPGKPLVTI